MSDYKRMAELVKTHQLDEAIPLLAPLVAGAKAIGGAVAKKIGGSLAKKGAGALAKKLNPAKLLKKGAGRMPNKFSGKGVNLNITTTPEEDKELAENLYARMADLLMESKADRRARKRQNQGKPLSNQPAVRKSQETIRANAPKPKGPSLGDRLKQFGRDKALPRLQRAGAGALVGAGMARQAAGEALGKARDRVSPVVSRAAAGAATKMQSALARAVTSPAPKVTSTIGPTATAAPAAPTASPTPVTPTAPTAPTSAPSKPSETAKPVPQSKPEPKPEPKPAPEKSQKTTKDEKPKKGSKLKTATRVATALAAAERQGMQAGPLDINN